MASGRRSMEPSARQSQPPDWLPPAHASLLMNNSRVGRFVETKKSRHWFLCFANAMFENDHAQAKMLAKAYAFLFDFMPEGLTGRWSHITGGDLMNILMSHTKETSVSRHKATYAAQASFEYLEEWMKKGATWREALSADSSQADGVRKRGPKKAPVLYSPAGLLALLIVSYPDPKFRNWIGRLQIEWMATPHNTLDIRKGFWKGITSSDLGFFQAEEPRNSEVPLLADYNGLFGPYFVRAKRDIRPYAPEWAKDLTLEDDLTSAEDLSDVETAPEVHAVDGKESRTVDDIEEADVEPDQELAALEKLLNPSPPAPADELQEWLVGVLSACGEQDVVMFWCKHWVGRTEEAPDRGSQLLTRSLFLDSARRVRSLSGSPHTASADALMLLEMEDGRDRSADTQDPALASRIQRLEKLPLYQPLLDAKARLYQLAGGADSRNLLDASFDGQMRFFMELIQDEHFNRHQEDVVTLETARINILLRAAAKTDVDSRITTTRGNGSPTFNLGSIPALNLSRWQMRAVAVSDSLAVLTAWQARTQSSQGQAVETDLVDLSQYGLAPAGEITAQHGGISPQRRHILRKLFGDLPSVPVAGQGGGAPAHTAGSSEQPSKTPRKQATALQDSIVARTPANPLTNGAAMTSEGVQTRARAGADTPWENPFRTVRTAKRAYSPDMRSNKMPRLAGDTTRDCIDELKKDVKNFSRDLEHLKTSLALSKDEVIDLVEERSSWACGQVAKRLDRAGEDTDAKLRSVTDTVKALLAEGAEERKAMQAQLQSITDTLEAFRPLLAAREQASRADPLPGQEGFLARHGPAPAGWDQKAYEAMLLRAGWYYVASVGSPDDGFEASPDAFDLTMQRFPGISSPHLVKCLEHVHSLAYNRPFQVEFE